MKTNAWQKLLVSVINTIFVATISLPFLLWVGFSIEYRIILVLIFLAYQLIVVLLPGRRTIGAVLTHSYWIKEYSITNHVIYAFLYSLSFATLVIWILVPFDLFVINMLLVQLPMIQRTGYTLHGYLSGKMVGTIKK